MTRLALYFHTVRHLRPQQVRHQILKRLRAVRPARAPGQALLQRSGLAAPLGRLPGHGAMTRDECTFLGVSAPLCGGVPDWAAPGMSRLWRYHLHYFDFLAQPDLSDELKARLVDDWIARNPPGTADAWDPFPVSLRIVNWVGFLLARPRQTIPRAWLTSLWTQAEWLQRNFEYHLLANHLLKNSVGLLFAGAYFSGPQADAWLRRGWREFLQQIAEQFLPDGGHYERSPMYHSLCLADCLDVLELVRQAPLAALLPGAQPLEQVEQVVQRAARFLADILAPDGEIPLFNDSAFGTAPPPRLLLQRAAELLGEPALAIAAGKGEAVLTLIEKPASGYFGFRAGSNQLLVDCGPIGPDHQPGHGHCDTLSYELSLDGQRVVIDSGVFDYEVSERRARARGTAGHNTVMIDGCEQSEIWGAFRVGRRASPLDVRIGRVGSRYSFEGAHGGYRHLPGRPVHRRRITCEPDFTVEVTDDIEGEGEHVAESRIRLHPLCRVVHERDTVLVNSPAGAPLARILFLYGLSPRIEAGSYFPQFGVEQSCTVLVQRDRGPLPLRLGCRIVRLSR